MIVDLKRGMKTLAIFATRDPVNVISTLDGSMVISDLSTASFGASSPVVLET